MSKGLKSIFNYLKTAAENIENLSPQEESILKEAARLLDNVLISRLPISERHEWIQRLGQPEEVRNLVASIKDETLIQTQARKPRSL